MTKSSGATLRSEAPEPHREERDDLIAAHKTMLLVRGVEERLARLFADGEVPGFIHLSIGQEAIAAGVAAVLRREDTIASTHRGHGHALAKGVSLEGFFQEILGRATGVCRGRGGSMHVADMSVGMLGANGIVGAGIPLAVGSALAHQIRKTGGIAVAFFGDGSLAEGVLHESLNLSALWKLPVLFVCENNGWSEFSPTSKQFVANIVELGRAFGIDGECIDGNDVAAVMTAAGRHAAAARRGDGPRILECMTRRVRGHFEGDPQRYRNDTDAGPDADPIVRSQRRLLELGVGEQELARMQDEAESAITAAVEAARKAPLPDIADAAGDVYTRKAA